MVFGGVNQNRQVDALQRGTDLKNVAGLRFRKGSDWIATPPATMRAKLDDEVVEAAPPSEVIAGDGKTRPSPRMTSSKRS